MVHINHLQFIHLIAKDYNFLFVQLFCLVIFQCCSLLFFHLNLSHLTGFRHLSISQDDDVPDVYDDIYVDVPDVYDDVPVHVYDDDGYLMMTHWLSQSIIMFLYMLSARAQMWGGTSQCAAPWYRRTSLSPQQDSCLKGFTATSTGPMYVQILPNQTTLPFDLK